MKDYLRQSWSGQFFILMSLLLLGALLGQLVVGALAGFLGMRNLEWLLGELEQGHYLEVLPWLKVLLILSHGFTFILPTLVYAYWWEGGPYWLRHWGGRFVVGRVEGAGGLNWVSLPRGGGRLYGLALILTLLAYPYLLGALWFNGYFTGAWEPQPLQVLLMRMGGLGDLFLNWLLVGLLAGLGEELFFRGGVQRIFLRGGLNPYWAIGLGALVFSLGHFDSPAFLPRFLFGYLFGYLYWRSGRIGIPIAAHVLHNSWQLILSYLWVDFEKQDISRLGFEFWHLAAGSAFLAGLYLYHQKTLFPPYESKNP